MTQCKILEGYVNLEGLKQAALIFDMPEYRVLETIIIVSVDCGATENQFLKSIKICGPLVKYNYGWSFEKTVLKLADLYKKGYSENSSAPSAGGKLYDLVLRGKS